jgi:hypothetical protein
MIVVHTLPPDQDKAIAVLLNLLRQSKWDSRSESTKLTDSDWQQILQQSIEQGIAPILYHHIHHLPGNAPVPNWVINKLHKLYIRNALRNMRHYHELYQILNALREKAIPVIVMKGAYLAQDIYDDFALRSMGDVDILVKKDHLLDVNQILLALGYRLELEYGDWSYYLANHYHFLYVSPDESMRLEVHWHIQMPGQPFRIDENEVWERALPTTVAGVETMAFCPEDLLIQICIQVTFQHPFDYYPLRSLYDIAEVVRFFGDHMNWLQVQQRSHQWGSEKCVYLALCLTRELLSANLPDLVLSDLEPQDFDQRFTGWARERMFTKVGVTSDFESMPSMSGRFGKVWTSHSLSARLSAFIDAVLPPMDLMAQLYQLKPGSIRGYFYYLVRWKDLLLKHGSKAWQLLSRNPETIALIDSEGKRAALIDWMTPKNQTC